MIGNAVAVGVPAHPVIADQPAQVLNRKRIVDAQLLRKTLALNLLENETLALAEIAFSLGYSEVSAFNHAFRRWVGQSPGDYRRQRAMHLRSAAAKTRD